MVKAKRGPVKRGAQQGRGRGAPPPTTPAGLPPKSSAAGQDGVAIADAARESDTSSVSPPAGLQNLGNTCFFNSALQVLAAAPAVQRCYGTPGQPGRQAALGSAMREVMRATSGVARDAEGAGASPPSAAGKRGGGGAAKRAGAAAHSPHRLLAAVRKIAPQFKGGGQQDSHELLRCLLAGLQTEECSLLKDKGLSTTPDADTSAQNSQHSESQDAGSAAAAGQAHAEPASDADMTVVESLFSGRLASTVVCGSCGHTSTQLERFMDLSLPVASVAASQPAGPEAPVSSGAGAAVAKPPRALNAKQRKAAAKQACERKTAKLARSRAARATSAELPGEAGAAVKGRRGKRVALTPAAIVRHSPPARGALPPRPAIRTGSMSSLASESEVSTATGQVSASALGSRRSADGREGGGSPVKASGGVGGGTPLQQHPMRLTMELMHSLSPPMKGTDDAGEEDPFLRAMSRASTPPTSVMSDLDSTAAARHSSGPPSLEGNSSDEEEALSPAGSRHRASGGGGASPAAVPAGASRLSRQSAAQPSWEQADAPGDQAATGAEAELRRADGPHMLLRGVEEPKLRGGAESLDDGDAAVPRESEAAASAAEAAAGRAAAEAEAAAGAIAAEAEAQGFGSPAAAAPRSAATQSAAMQRQHSFLDDSIQVAGAAATAEAAGRATAGADAISSPGAAAAAGAGTTSEPAAGADQPTAAGPSPPASISAFAAAAQQPAEARQQEAPEASDSDGGDAGALGSLFDDSRVQAAPASAPLAADDWSADPAAAKAEMTLQDCLAAFFAPEAITYTCPREAAAAKAAASAATVAAVAAASPKAGADSRLLGLCAAPSGESGGSEASAARKVSWSDSPHVVVMIPGSEEQRGTDLRAALKGHEPFSRPLSHNGASLLVTAHMDQFRNDTLTLQIHPHDMELSTVAQLDRTLDLTTVTIDRIQEFDSREEQGRVQEAAQILMDCVADIVDCHGLGPLRSMCEAMQLQRVPSGEVAADAAGGAISSGGAQQQQQRQQQQPLAVQYCVTGVMPDGVSRDGWKTWTYPSAEHPRPSGATGGAAPAARAASLDTLSSGSLDFAPSSTSSCGGDGPLAAAAEEMPLPAALEHAAGLSRRLAGASLSSPSSEGGASGSSESDGGGAVVVVDERLYASAPDLAQLAAAAEVEPHGGTGSAAAAVEPVATAATAVATVDGAAAAAGAAVEVRSAAAAPAAAGRGGKPPAGAKAVKQGEPDVAAAAATSPGPAVKSYAIQQPPQLLTLHLKRFEQDKRGHFLKVSRRVRFSFQLDVSQYLSQSAAGSGPDVAAVASGDAPSGSQQAAEVPAEQAGGCSCPAAGGGSKQQQAAAVCYQLVGLVEHSGTMRSGHYVAYVQRSAAAVTPAADAVPEPRPHATENGPSSSPSAAAGTNSQPALQRDADGQPNSPAGSALTAAGDSAVSPQQSGATTANIMAGVADRPEQLAWFRVSDQHVKRVTWAQVLAAEAYLLLYAQTSGS